MWNSGAVDTLTPFQWLRATGERPERHLDGHNA